MDFINTTFCTSEYEGSGFVDQARARFVGSGVAADCDLDQTRREAADRVLVRKGARSLGARTDGTHESTVGNAPSGVIRGDKPGQRQPTPVRDVARKLGRNQRPTALANARFRSDKREVGSSTLPRPMIWKWLSRLVFQR
jgi:hypothetical protein